MKVESGVAKSERVAPTKKAGSTPASVAIAENPGKEVVDAGSHTPEVALIPGEKCSICGAGVYLAPVTSASAARWKCVGPRTHSMAPREPK